MLMAMRVSSTHGELLNFIELKSVTLQLIWTIFCVKNIDGIVHHMKYHYFNIPDEDNVTSCIKVTSYNPNYVLRGWTKQAPAYYANSCVKYGDDQRVCFCSFDGCNGAWGLNRNSYMLAVVAAVLTLLLPFNFD